MEQRQGLNINITPQHRNSTRGHKERTRGQGKGTDRYPPRARTGEGYRQAPYREWPAAPATIAASNNAAARMMQVWPQRGWILISHPNTEIARAGTRKERAGADRGRVQTGTHP